MLCPITGMWVDNITCSKCRARHPGAWSCAQAADVAAVQRQVREEQRHTRAMPAPEPEPQSLRDAIASVLDRAGPLESRTWLLDELESTILTHRAER